MCSSSPKQVPLSSLVYKQNAGNSVSEGLDLKIFWDPDPLEMTRNVTPCLWCLIGFPLKSRGLKMISGWLQPY